MGRVEALRAGRRRIAPEGFVAACRLFLESTAIGARRADSFLTSPWPRHVFYTH
jgi:hypothetical protein